MFNARVIHFSRRGSCKSLVLAEGSMGTLSVAWKWRPTQPPATRTSALKMKSFGPFIFSVILGLLNINVHCLFCDQLTVYVPSSSSSGSLVVIYSLLLKRSIDFLFSNVSALFILFFVCFENMIKRISLFRQVCFPLVRNLRPLRSTTPNVLYLGSTDFLESRPVASLSHWHVSGASLEFLSA